MIRSFFNSTFDIRYSAVRFVNFSTFDVLRFVSSPFRHSIFDIRYSAVLFLPVFCGLILLGLPSGALAQICKGSILANTREADFNIHDDGTVTHRTTGLMWMRCSLGQKWDGKTCSGTAAAVTWADGLKAAAGHEFAGYRDWRLPNKNELESIVEESCFTPAINAIVFPGTPLAYFWSSSPYAGLSNGAWSVDFGFGAVNASVKGGSVHVRLVRGGQ
jgi:hypothetical protein